MPELTIPFIGNPTARNLNPSVSASGKDQIFKGVLFTQSDTKQKESSTIFCNKRPGYASSQSTVATDPGRDIWNSPSTGQRVVAFSPSNSVGATIYATTLGFGVKTCGTLDTASSNIFYGITETIINDSTFFLIAASGQGYYLPNDALTISVTFTGDTHSNTTIDNVSSLTGLYVGQLLTGSGIAANTRIATITAPSTITVTVATTATASTVTITRTHLAKIISANFPTTAIGKMEEMDGYVFVMTTTGRIYNSDINSITNWSADNYISCQQITDNGAGIGRFKNRILGFGTSSIEEFYNAGNPSGSPLSRVLGALHYVGLWPVQSSAANYQQTDFFAFPAKTNNGFAGIYQYSDGAIKKVSNSIIEALIGQPTQAFRVYEFNANHYIYMRNASSGIEMLYCSENDTWTFGNYGTNFPVITSAGDTLFMVLNGTDSSGTIYSVGSPVYQDNGVAYTMTIQTELFYLNNGEPFFIDDITLIADTQSSGTTAISATADDYANFGTIGNFDLTQQQKNLPCGGYYDTSVGFKLTDSGNNANRLQGLKIKWRPAA